MSQLKKAIAPLVWVGIAFHFLVIILIPNRESYLNQVLSPIFLPYSNFLNVNTAWQFFSPDPGPPVYLLSTVRGADAVLAEEFMPPEKDEFFWRQKFNRRIAVMRFATKDPERARRVLVPYYCHLYPEAVSVTIDKIQVPVPSLESIRAGGALNDLSSQVTSFYTSGECERGVLVE